MADEAIQTDVTNSMEAPDAIPTDATAPAADGSTTETPAVDPLDAPSALGDAPPAAAEGGDGDKPSDTGSEAVGEDGGEGKEPDATPLTGAPDGDYDLAGLLPEGTTIDTDALARIAPVAKDLNLSNAGLARIAAEGLPIVQKQVMDGIIGDVVSQRAEWDKATRLMISGGKDGEGNDVRPDPAFGGQSYDAVLATAAKALDRFGGAGTREFLKETGLGNDPRMVMFAFKAGQAISEDNDFQRGGGIPNTPKSREEKYYGDSAG